jgi:D-alanine-D-alanine ligase
MRITVLRGGPSAEREISLISGKAVADGLRSMGHEVFESDISPTNVAGLDHPADVIFPVLHGQFGESGELQEILEKRGLAFVGSGSAASRMGMDKVASKQAWERAGLPTPPYEVLTPQHPTLGKISAPCVVKVINSGSSIDVFICKTQDQAQKACQNLLAKYGRVLVEKFIKGPEITIGILEERPLDPIRIVSKREFFDYEAKYNDKGTEHRFDTGLPAAVIARCQETARKANNAIGCRDLGRVDIMLDEQLNPYLLEINTLPGFTPVSLLPEAARHSGIAFGPLVDRLARRAYDRHQKAAVSR